MPGRPKCTAQLWKRGSSPARPAAIAARIYLKRPAAWVCDYARAKPGAIECRLKAAALFQKAKENGQDLGEQAGVAEAVITDLLRRAGKLKLGQKSLC